MQPSPRTLRVSGIPANAQPEHLRQHFLRRLPAIDASQILIGPFHDHHDGDTKSSVITFASPELAGQAHRLENPSLRLSGATLRVDSTFGLLTTLYSSSNPHADRPDKPDVDIVAIHDVYGHPWYSFATSNPYGDGEENWLKDSLPQLLESGPENRIHARVMSFGYRPDLWITQTADKIRQVEEGFLECLRGQRRSDPCRPLYLISHGLGSLLAKQLFIDLILRSIQESKPSPLGGLILFGAPNQIDDPLHILDRFNSAYGVGETLVDPIGKQNHIADLSSQFNGFRRNYDLSVFCFVQAEQSNSMVVVQPESGVFNYQNGPDPYFLKHRDHFTMTNLTASEQEPLHKAKDFLVDSVNKNIKKQSFKTKKPRNATKPSAQNGRVRGKEDRLSELKKYDIIFLVDDSGSMEIAGRWELVQTILAHSTEIATEYDTNGIEIRFFNSDEGRDGISDPKEALDIIKSVEPQGETPTLDLLQEYLDRYMYEFEQKRHDRKFKRLNLIVLTDGEPSETYEHKDDISDIEDAKKNRAVNRKIRKLIVKTARKLDKLGALDHQVGVQFCQIGIDEQVEAFFKYLDDKLRADHGVRDIVDTIRCEDEGKLDDEFYENLLTGAINRVRDNREQKATGSRMNSLPVPREESASNTLRDWVPDRRSTHGGETSGGATDLEAPVEAMNFADEDYDFKPNQSQKTYLPRQTTSPKGKSRSPLRTQTLPMNSGSMPESSNARPKSGHWRDRLPFLSHSKER